MNACMHDYADELIDCLRTSELKYYEYN